MEQLTTCMKKVRCNIDATRQCLKKPLLVCVNRACSLMQDDRYCERNQIRERRSTDQKLVTEYRYECQNRLIGVSLPGGSTASYKYDAFGRRIEKPSMATLPNSSGKANGLSPKAQPTGIAATSTNRTASAHWPCSTAKVH